MNRIALVCLLLGSPLWAADKPAAARKPNELTREEIQAGWIKLFDGASLFGWKANSDIDWKVKDGVIQAAEGMPGLLVTDAEFADYELKVDFKMAAGGNSGVFLHTLFEPKSPATECYELNICDVHPMGFTTGSIVAVQKSAKTVSGEGAWKTFHITVQGSRVKALLDGELVIEMHDKRPEARTHGYIGLQKNAGAIEFKNVFLRPLSAKPLFNGKDLTGWRVVPGGVSQFEVVEGTVQVTNGRGYLETEQSWADFLLQAEVRTNGPHLNSGIFFRALPGTEKNPADGYECQIRNQWEGTDRTKPVDFGTGAIYRRIATRKVVSTDKEWFTMTLLARGPRINVWVDGEPVTSWTDTRKPDPNPRNGLRLEPGRLSLQGHDPTTDLSFRNFRLAEFPK